MANYKTFDIPAYENAPFHSNNALRWVAFFVRPFRWPMLGYLLLNTARKTFIRLEPLYIALAVSVIESDRVFDDPSLIWKGLAAFAAMSCLVHLVLLPLARLRYMWDNGARVMTLFGVRHLAHLSHDWHEESGSGGKLQQVVRARRAFQAIGGLVSWQFVEFAAGFIAIAISLAAMNLPFYYFFLFLGFFASFILVAIWTGKAYYKLNDVHNKTFEDVSSTVYEFVNSVTTVKAFNLHDMIMRRGKGKEEISASAFRRMALFDYARWSGLNFIGLFWILLIAGMAYQGFLNGNITVAAATMLAYTVFQVWGYFETSAMMYAYYLEERNGLMRLVETLKEKARIQDASDATRLKVSSAQIHFKDVDFDYNAKAAVFENLNLVIPAGQKLGVVGKSGAGKSTLVSLLMRFYDLKDGRGSICINGHDIRAVTLESLRNAIAVIPQDTVMFNHSLVDNIRYGHLKATDAEVKNAAQLAHANQFIEALPDGYQTLVGERGLRLSGGQRQRIAIARAVLKDAPILVLDEATAALDSESETLIQQSLESIMHGKTVIAIAHRLSTLISMDRIIVMDRGRIVEDGTHDELLNQNGIYSNLWQTQSGGFIKD